MRVTTRPKFENGMEEALVGIGRSTRGEVSMFNMSHFPIRQDLETLKPDFE